MISKASHIALMTKFSILFSSILMLSSCATKEREGFVKPEDAANIYEIAEFKDIGNEKVAAVHTSEAAFKTEVSAREKSDAVLISKRLKALALKVADDEKDEAKKKQLQASLEKSNFAFAIEKMDRTESYELRIYRVETETSITNLDRDKSITVKTLRLSRAISESKDEKKKDDLYRDLQKLNREEGGQSKQIHLVLVNSFPIEKFGIMGHNRTDYGEKKSTLGVQATDRSIATHLVLGKKEKVEATEVPKPVEEKTEANKEQGQAQSNNQNQAAPAEGTSQNR